jgi:serine/threonine protein kinase
MQFVEGESLADKMERRGRFPLKEAIHIVKEVAKGLDIAHESGLVHRDIKPDNILISNRGEVMITDFGLVKRDDDNEKSSPISSVIDPNMSAGLTLGGSILGTPIYMAPEQCQGLPDIDGRADIYSLGLILYALVTGQLPVIGDTAMQIMQNRLIYPPKPPIEVNPAIGPALNGMILHMLELDPAQRLAPARRVIEVIDRIGAQLLAPRPAQAPARSAHRSTSRRLENRNPPASPPFKLRPRAPRRAAPRRSPTDPRKFASAFSATATAASPSVAALPIHKEF